MKIGIIGTGAIGGLILAYLSDRGNELYCTGRPYQVASFLKEGLFVEGVRGNTQIKNIKIATILKEKVDLAILAVKTQDLEEAIGENKSTLKNAILVTTQNGVKAEYVLAGHFKKKDIVTAIVMFGSTFIPPNKIVHNFEGEVVLGDIFKEGNEDTLPAVKSLFQGAFDCSIVPDIQGAKYLKIFVNLNNCIPACLGVPMQEAFADISMCKTAIGLIREAYAAVRSARIELQSLPSFNKEKVLGFVNREFDDAASLFSKIMTALSKEPLYGSLLQSIQRKKKTEIDYINGQIVELAKQHAQEAPLNEKITEMVHKVENTGRFFSKEDFLKEVAPLVEKYS